MLHLEDRETLGTMLGVDAHSLPADVERECGIRLKMFHQAGGSGPLGVLPLISLLRSLGKGPLADPEPAERTEWRNLPTDGSVRVEARFFRGWQPGVFLGFVQHGTLAIRLDGIEEIQECRPDVVRLSQEPPAEPEPGVEEAGDTVPTEPVVVPTGEPVEEDATDWKSVATGSGVYVLYDEDYVRSRFLGLGPAEGELRVDIEGVGEQTVAQDQVRRTRR